MRRSFRLLLILCALGIALWVLGHVKGSGSNSTSSSGRQIAAKDPDPVAPPTLEGLPDAGRRAAVPDARESPPGIRAAGPTVRDAAGVLGVLGEMPVDAELTVVDPEALAPGARLVRGVVTDRAGTPCAGAPVFVVRTHHPAGTTRSAADGTWALRLRDVAEGEVLSAFAVGGKGRSSVVRFAAGGSAGLVLDR